MRETGSAAATDKARLLLKQCAPTMVATAGQRTKKQDERGFTLIELSAVVTIVGILSVVAVVGYRRLVVSSHINEATGMVNSIRVAQEGYHAETGNYASPSSGTPPWPTAVAGSLSAGDSCPLTHPSNSKTGWNPGCGGGSTWATLPLHVDGPVMYGYWSIAGTGTTISSGAYPGTINGTGITTINTPSGEWYTVTAVGDPDGDGKFSAVFGCSATNDLMVQGEGY